MTPPRWRLQ
ncbi:unnamed protein product [Gulo gulo]|uniref:Uncharacterized protein n=1 Tax=Gulo gulo TaxID=48420 RepID=A0A9X9LEH3_GULGU|nr:unnamed protein product [Gulo gulo]